MKFVLTFLAGMMMAGIWFQNIKPKIMGSSCIINLDTGPLLHRYWDM